ncbi:hypothetical protein [Aeromicrobium fastidiosum]|uniref:hypothetical protein n=1 Tax=Aeromicrobium fastidiosum TaxID=52699 RepID=UPI001D7335CF|nr:hypothetical protein [Aeromicrobium fastidiosum]MBP2390164.1 hypothetical protein [Aeromicrobium fastidiosum]
MTLAVQFHPEADAEFIAGADWYDERERGLRRRFLGAVRASVEAAAEDPDAWPSWPGWAGAPVVPFQGSERLSVPRRLLRRR